MPADYESPAIDASRDEELKDWIDQKKGSFPDSNV
jgi:trimethylamine:corrinoid methyltransferase-like protein